ncbi:CHAT domain-containing protein [Marivirga sp. S37H4]|uniref:CHAT domain-containing protein n=1 Tax=Marivirga aurantiaca TaxID=2802615 RepID=A0A935C765_9BACT|nr:CHAT domain-containing tetratricopeptide repeat protein [Marivirga aurantiaca]MBK6264177.1 CHAT domain-containing protein [Marivirga aurantiaca]
MLRILFIVSSLLLFSSSLVDGQALPLSYQDYLNRAKTESLDSIIHEIDQLETNNENSALLGELFLLKGRNDLSTQYLDRAIKNMESTASNQSELYCRALSNKAIVLWNEGKEDNALEYLHEALRLRNTRKNPQSSVLADNYNNLGLVYSGVSYEESKAYYLKSLALYKQQPKENLNKIIQTTINISLQESSKENYKEASKLLYQALDEWKKNHSSLLPTEAFILVNLANIDYKKGDLKLAEENYLEAIDIYLKNYGERNSELANAYMLLGDLYNAQSEFKNALLYNQKALIANSFEFNSPEPENNPKLTDAIKPYNQLVILLRKAKIYENYYYGYSIKKQHLELAMEALALSDDLIKELRTNMSSKKDLLALSDLASEVYENAQGISLRLQEVSLFGKEYAQQAFFYAEKAKGSSLLSALVESEAKNFAKVPADLIEQENKLQNEIAFLGTQIALNKSNITELRALLFTRKNQYENLIKRLETEFPEYYNLKHNLTVASLEEIQSTIASDEAILNYSFNSASDELYVYFISQDQFKISVVPEASQINKYIRAFRNTLVYNLKPEFETISYQLYEYLLPHKIPGKITQLTIIPDGELGKIPFEALLMNKEKTPQAYHSLDYLIKRYEVNYAFSATLHMKEQKKPTNNEALLVAPILFESNLLSQLPGTKKELGSIQEICDNKNIQSRQLTYAEASEENFKNGDLKKYKYIHLATHGVVDVITPELSGVFFNKADDMEDGILYTSEIYSLDINADLVSLSACETGLGKVSRGEGILGLGRAFTYAGAQNLMVSIWKVADESTSVLMTRFYDNSITKNESYSSGLRKAKLDMINSDNAAPYYWAPFILWGK